MKSGGGRGQGRRTTSASHYPSKGGAIGGRATSAADYDDEEEDDEDDEGGGGGGGGGDGDQASTSRAVDDPSQKADREKLGLLVDAFDREQFERYEMFRRIKFKKETVRKITNYVVSQSVPPSVVLSINGFAKTFVGVLIERARRVQREAVVAARKGGKGKRGGFVQVDRTDFTTTSLAGGVAAAGGVKLNVNANANPGLPVDPARLIVGVNGMSGIATTAAVVDGDDEEEGLENLGPLMPDHLREALRRYKRDGEGGGTGLAGMSVGLGVQGVASARLQGKRLFK